MDNNPKRLTRSSDNVVFTGVAAGIAEYLNLDPTLVRLGFVLLTLIWGGGAVIYLVLWLVMPTNEGGTAAANLRDQVQRSEMPAGRRTVDIPSRDGEDSLHAARPLYEDAPEKAKRSVSDAEDAAERLRRSVETPADADAPVDAPNGSHPEDR